MHSLVFFLSSGYSPSHYHISCIFGCRYMLNHFQRILYIGIFIATSLHNSVHRALRSIFHLSVYHCGVSMRVMSESSLAAHFCVPELSTWAEAFESKSVQKRTIGRTKHLHEQHRPPLITLKSASRATTGPLQNIAFISKTSVAHSSSLRSNYDSIR